MKNEYTVIESFDVIDPTLGVIEVDVIKGLRVEGFICRMNGRTRVTLSADLSHELRKVICSEMIKREVEVLADEWPEFLNAD